MQKISHLVLALAFACLLACSKQADDAAKKTVSLPLITVTQADAQNLEIREESIGTVEGLIDPNIGAEVNGRIIKLMTRVGEPVRKGQALLAIDPTDLNLQRVEAQAEVARVQALISNQEKMVERNQVLLSKHFISQNALDDVSTQLNALQRQLEAAQAKIAIIEHNRNKTLLYSPVDGTVEKLIVAVGEYVKVGDPLMQIVSRQKLRANLPLPERIAPLVKIGMPVRITTPAVNEPLIVQISELKPLINSDSRALYAVVDIPSQAGWNPGASVTGSIILGQRQDAILVPEQSVVLRPAGEVVYVIEQQKAQQRLVKTGLLQDGKIEIREGLKGGETVAVDGAAMLTDQAKVNIKSDAKHS